MRFDVHTVRCHLVNELLQTPQVKEVWHDGSDVVIMDFKTGESVAVHMIERFMSVDEIAYIFNENAQNKHYTMLILWADMFMPADGQRYEPNDWMITLLQLYGGKIYAYDAWRDEPYIFTVHFQRIPNSREFMVTHGKDVNIGMIGTNTIETTMTGFKGFWRIAKFDGYDGQTTDDFWDADQNAAGERTSVRFYLNLLGLGHDADREQVKRAYRDMARQHHPDLNRDTDTTHKMQRINDAYRRILQYFDSEAKSD